MEVTISKAEKEWEALWDKLQSELRLLHQEQLDPVKNALASQEACAAALFQLKTSISALTFTSVSEEIQFFKRVKPKFHHLFMFYSRVYTIELRRPVSLQEQEKYYKKEIYKADVWLDDLASFQEYYRAGASHRDEQYFTRAALAAAPAFEWQNGFGIELDRQFSTLKDQAVALLLAGEKLIDFLTHRLQHLSEVNLPPVVPSPARRLQWKKKRVDLGELLYALHADDAFGLHEIKALADAIAEAWGYDVGNVYKLFEEIRLRKKESLPYLLHLIEITKEQMDKDNERAR